MDIPQAMLSLQRRADFISHRLTKENLMLPRDDWDRAELAALECILNELERQGYTCAVRARGGRGRERLTPQQP